ncbi:MAG TPA: hypothetical protein VFR66_10960 [Burkholderiales bacterium]|nr:hypothetical protein [Burkholderiales bacterium]
MRGATLLLLACLGACSPVPEADLRLVTIHNAESGFSLRELPPPTLRALVYVSMNLAAVVPHGATKGVPPARDTLLRT